jgi:putrescine aminotransferase
MIRTYWAEQGQPDRQVVIARWNGYHGSSVGSGSLGGMKGMHAQGGMPIPGIVHIDQPNWWTSKAAT